MGYSAKTTTIRETLRSPCQKAAPLIIISSIKGGVDMGTEQENHPFEWLSGNGGNGPVFPIDYSQRSFAEYLGRDPRQVKRYLIDHPFFRDILQEQFCKNQGNGKFPNRSDNAIISIPAESAVFFKCFYE